MNLKMWMTPPADTGVVSGTLPTPTEALYRTRNAREGASCASCTFHRPDDACARHDTDVVASDTSWCRLYSEGLPLPPDLLDRLAGDALPYEARTTGIVLTRSGAHCANCKSFQPQTVTEGCCTALRDEDSIALHPIVASRGICIRWDAGGSLEPIAVRLPVVP